MSLIDQHRPKQLTGHVYVKCKGVKIMQRYFPNKTSMLWHLRLLLSEYPMYDVSVIFDDVEYMGEGEIVTVTGIIEQLDFFEQEY